tara:strand:- start:23 stop:703 length:681 start_codon:yes stop_codon:yes gene_type:complete
MTTLYIVSTPIGNLGDISYRAVEVLKNVDTILCEDTRVTKRLLDHYDIEKPTLSYHANSGIAKAEKIMELLEQGSDLALVSDAGTPTISDPGVLLVSQVRERFGDDVQVIAIPGASALLAALATTGFSGPDFTFLGFLPHKKGRETLFREISESQRTVIFYESVHRIMKTLVSLVEHVPDHQIQVSRELTKIHEEHVQGVPQELLDYYHNNPDKVRGEFVVVVNAK